MTKEIKRPYVSALVPAAGEGTRMEGLDKRFVELVGIPVLVHTLLALAESDWIDEIVVIVRADEIAETFQMIGDFLIPKIRSVVAGGETRQQSVQNGLEAVSSQTCLIAIHDGARPLVSREVIAETVLDASSTGASAAAVPVIDTIKVSNEKRRIVSTPDRNVLYAVQTPQVFDLEKYRAAAALAQINGKNYTDDCQMLEAAGETVLLSRGDYRNMKITTPVDLIVAQALLECEKGAER